MAITGDTQHETKMETRTEHGVHTWERWSTVPLAILALLYLGL